MYKRFLLSIALMLVAALLVEAQQPKKVSHVGYLAGGSPATAGHHAQAFVQGLRELGYLEGQNIVLEYRWAEGKVERLPGLVADLVHAKVDVIVSSAAPAIRFAKEQTITIPIVMAGVIDPVRAGFVASLARPGGNITGLTHLSPDLSGKRLKLLKEVVPRLSRLGVLWNPNHPGQPTAFKDTHVAAQALKVTVISMEARNREEIERVLSGVEKERLQALL